MIAMMVCNILKEQNTQKRAMHLQFLCAHEILYCILKTWLILHGCHPLILYIQEHRVLTVFNRKHHNIDFYCIQSQTAVLYSKCISLSGVSGRTTLCPCSYGFFSNFEFVNDILKFFALLTG